MRAVMRLKNTNLSWQIILNHFKTYSQIISGNSVQNIKPKGFSTVSDYTEYPESSNKLNDSFLKNIKSSNECSQIIQKDVEIDHNNELFYERLSQQLSVIEQIPKDFIKEDTAIINNSLECTVHSCLLPLRQELQTLFPDRNVISKDTALSVLCLNHHTQTNMSSWDSSVAREREALAHMFVSTAKDICLSLTACGFWADFIDPYSGTPFLGSHTNDTLFETDARMRNFGMDVADLGCCKVLSHPLWKENVFMGLIFTDAPHDHPLLSSVNTL